MKENRIWQCNICRESCCCCHGDCQIRHRHCFTYTRTKRRYEKAKRLDIQQQQLQQQQQRTKAGLAGPTNSQSATIIENYSRVPKKPATPVDQVQVSSVRPFVTFSITNHPRVIFFMYFRNYLFWRLRYRCVPKEDVPTDPPAFVWQAALRSDESPSGSFHASMSAFGTPSGTHILRDSPISRRR